MARRIERIFLVAILVLALGVRLYGLGFSLPFTSHPDEPNVVDHAVATIKTGNWNPDWFIYPTGYHYLQVGVLSLHLLWGIAQGLYTSPADLPDSSHTITSAPEAYRWARGTTVLFGVLTVFLVYRLGRHLYGPAAGLSGALLLALSPLHVEHSRYVTTDVPTAALSLLAVYLAVEALERGGLGRAFLAGLVVGLAGAFKYNAVVGVLPLLLALLLRHVRLGRPQEGLLRPLGRFFHSELALACFGLVGGYLVACPYTLANLARFLADMGKETHIYRFGGQDVVIRTYEVAGRSLPPWQAYAHALWVQSPPAALAFLGGLGLALFRRTKGEVVLLSFVAGYYLFLNSYASIFVRNVLPALPGLAVLGGGFLALGTRWLLERPPWRRVLARWQPLALAGLTVGMLVPAAGGILGAASYLATPTSEVQAREWLDAHLSPDDRVAAELHPLLFPHALYRVTPVQYLSNYPLQALVNLGYGYVVVNSERYGPEYALQDTFPEHYRPLLETLERVADFPGHTQNRPGPRLTIFRVPPGELRPQIPLETTAGPGLRLRGADVGHRRGEGDLAYVDAATTFRAGEVLSLMLYLQADQPFPEECVVAVRLRDVQGRAVAAVEKPLGGGSCPPTGWTPGTVIVDRRDLPLGTFLPAGTYRLEVQLLTQGALAIPLAEITLLERSP